MAGSMCIAAVFLMSCAVLQADQCSSGGKCPSSNETQSVVSLLQKKLQINVLERSTEDVQASWPYFAFGEKGNMGHCPLGYSMILDYATCEEAVEFFNDVLAALRGDAADDTHYPGCTFYDGGSQQAYFNSNLDPDGTIPQNENYGQICVIKASTTEVPTTEAPTTEAPTTEAAPQLCACENPGHRTLKTCTLPKTCSCNGEARLGLGSNWSLWKKVTGSIQCASGAFGGDPWKGQAKECQCKEAR